LFLGFDHEDGAVIPQRLGAAEDVDSLEDGAGDLLVKKNEGRSRTPSAPVDGRSARLLPILVTSSSGSKGVQQRAEGIVNLDLTGAILLFRIPHVVIGENVQLPFLGESRQISWITEIGCARLVRKHGEPGPSGPGSPVCRTDLLQICQRSNDG
jgi:hypothetical protein